MQVQLSLVFYGLLMVSLAIIVRWEGNRRRKGPSLKPGDLDQLKSPRLSYTPPPDRSKRSLDAARR
jgi:hypothetical protein